MNTHRAPEWSEELTDALDLTIGHTLAVGGHGGTIPAAVTGVAHRVSHQTRLYVTDVTYRIPGTDRLGTVTVDSDMPVITLTPLTLF